MKVVEHINSKNNFVALAAHLGIAIPKTLCFNSKEWFAGIKAFPYPCYIKPAVSVSGKGIYRCTSPEEVVQALSWFAEGVPLQVQEEVGSQVFLNVQYYADDRGLRPWIVTEQVLNGYSHAGNRFPARAEPWDAVDSMAGWLYRKGIRGVFAFDVAIVEAKIGRRYLPIECNPRYNGASYPSGIACKLGLEAWVAKEFNTRHRRLAEIDLGGIEYDPVSRSGVIIINWGTILVGKLSCLIAGTQAQQAGIEEELLKRL